MSFVTRPSDSGCKNLFPRACAAVVSVSIAALERPARGLGHRLRAHVATYKLPSSRAALSIRKPFPLFLGFCIMSPTKEFFVPPPRTYYEAQTARLVRSL